MRQKVTLKDKHINKSNNVEHIQKNLEKEKISNVFNEKAVCLIFSAH